MSDKDQENHEKRQKQEPKAAAGAPETNGETDIEVIIADENEADEDPVLLRLIYAVIFYFVYTLSRFVIGVVAIVQFLHVLLTEEYQEDLMRFSRSLTRFISQVVGYITWVSNKKPFPFSDWPSDANERGDG